MKSISKQSSKHQDLKRKDIICFLKLPVHFTFTFQSRYREIKRHSSLYQRPFWLSEIQVSHSPWTLLPLSDSLSASPPYPQSTTHLHHCIPAPNLGWEHLLNHRKHWIEDHKGNRFQGAKYPFNKGNLPEIAISTINTPKSDASKTVKTQ